MLIKELTNEQFYTFTMKFKDSSVYQSNAYAFVMNKQDYESIFIGLFDNLNNIVGASLILIEKIKNYKYAYAPRGFLIDYKDTELMSIFTEELKKYLKRKDIIAIKIAPLIVKEIYNPKTKESKKNTDYDSIYNHLTSLGFFHLGYNNYFEALKPRFDVVINLELPLYNLFNNIKKEYRTKIRSAINKGILIYKGTEVDIPHLYKHTEHKYPRDIKYFNDAYFFFNKSKSIDLFYAKLDFSKYLSVAKNNYLKLEDHLNKINDMIVENKGVKNTNLIKKKMAMDVNYDIAKKNLVEATNLVQKQEELIFASILTIKHKDEVFVFMDGMDPKYKNFNAKHLLIWTLIEKYKKEGFKTFNLGGISNPNLSNNKYQGLVDFKTNFGGYVIEYAGDFELIINNPKYLMFKNSFVIQNIMKR